MMSTICLQKNESLPWLEIYEKGYDTLMNLKENYGNIRATFQKMAWA